MHKHTMREPFLRISKRGSIALPHAWGIRVSSVILAMILGALFVVAVTGLNPLDVYASMYRGAFGTERNAWVTIREAMMLLCIGIGLAPAFKMKFWNIGAEGQVLVGAVCAAGLMIKIGAGLPNGLLLLLMAAAGMLGGAIWGIIPALFKAKWNSNETLFTLMMNYVAIQITSYCVALWENPRGSNKVGVINQMNKAGWFPKLFGQDYLLNVILVLLLAVFMFVYLKYSKQGFEIAVVGESTNTARYASIRISRVYMRTMALSGAICGLAGFIAVAGADYTISTSTADGRGFTAIIVAWLAKFNTFVMILISFLIVFLQRGASEIASDFNLNEEASNVITGIILFCIIGSEFFINYKTRLNRRKEDAK